MRRAGVLPFLDRGAGKCVDPYAAHSSVRGRTESDAARAGFFAPAAQRDLVAVLQKRALLAIRQLDRAFAVPRELDQASMRVRRRPQIVPEANRSPARSTAPFAVACASC